MATVIAQLAPSNSTDATFRAWSKGIHDSIIALGWVQTADTGQINFATVLKPTIGAYSGYTVYSMNDALQATHPCYLRIDWGASNIVDTALGTKWQISTGTNGAGTLNGNIATQITLTTINSSETTTSPCYFSGNSSRLTVAIWTFTAANQANYKWMLNIERSLDSSGTETNTGIGFRSTFTSGSGTSFQQFMPNAGLGALPAQEAKWLAFGAFSVTPGAGQNYSSISGVQQAYGPLLEPELGYMVSAGQFAYAATVSVTRFSVSRVYISVPNDVMSANAISYGAIPKFLMLWE